jgi:outer membrane protein TolC
VNIVTGVNAPQGPQRGGSGFGGAAAGFFGVAGLATTAGGGGGGAGGGGGGGGVGAAQAGGYLGLLQDARQIANLRANVAGLRRSLEMLEALYEANRIDRLQVDLARQQLFNQQSTLLTTEANYQLSLDNFKNTLGMPPCLPIRIEDPLLDQFELLGPDMVALQTDAGVMQARLAAPANGNGVQSAPPAPVEGQEQLERDLDLLRQAAEMLRISQNLIPPGANPFQALRDRFQVYEGRVEELRILGNDLERAIQQMRSYPAAIELAKALQQSAQQQLPEVEASLELLRSRADDRIESLKSLAEREEVRSGMVDRRAFDIEAFRQQLFDLPAEYAQIDGRLSAPPERWDNRREQLLARQAAVNSLLTRFSQLLGPLRAAVESLKAELARPGVLMLPNEAQRFLDELNRLVDDPNRGVERLVADMRQVRELLDAVFQEANILAQDAYALGLVQARARLEATRLIPIDLDQCTAMRVARENRLDLMNARAGLVDAWRLIQVRADASKAGLDVVFDGQIDTLGDNPFRFRSPTGQLRAGLRWDTPITRLAERNIYRQELIRFQRARRTFINFNDTIDRSLRNILRTIELNQVNFELRRAAVHLAIEQVELAALRLQEPPRPGVVAESLGVTTARDLLDALNALLQAQNNYLSVFVNYEQLRMQLDLDLGTMLLDDQGMWIDPGEISDTDFGGCSKENAAGAVENVPLPPEDATSEALAPPDISTLILLPSDEELGRSEESTPPEDPKPAAPPQKPLAEPRRLDAAAIESAKAVPRTGQNWAGPSAASGWKPAKAVSGP